jgi:hypothetical protein
MASRCLNAVLAGWLTVVVRARKAVVSACTCRVRVRRNELQTELSQSSVHEDTDAPFRSVHHVGDAREIHVEHDSQYHGLGHIRWELLHEGDCSFERTGSVQYIVTVGQATILASSAVEHFRSANSLAHLIDASTMSDREEPRSEVVEISFETRDGTSDVDPHLARNVFGVGDPFSAKVAEQMALVDQPELREGSGLTGFGFDEDAGIQGGNENRHYLLYRRNATTS